MSYTFQPGEMYRMPTHFGPATGPRRGHNGRIFDGINSPKSVSLRASFLSNAKQLENLLPPGFELYGEPVVTVSETNMTEIEWLAGRGYSVLGVTIPARFKGEKDTAIGPFLTVLWENLADPIITGREELGFSKIYCELPDIRVVGDSAGTQASWLGFTFLDMEVSNLKAKSNAEPASPEKVDGQLHYKYMPRTGEWGTADTQYAVITPAEGSHAVVHEDLVGDGKLRWNPARWEDLPTFYQVVNAFADLEVKEFLGGGLTRSTGGKDLSDQHILY
ncbi:MAG: acetoacetate decarboxylase family protein [Dehalococcoidia bacterium]|nr:acetoacetate decarboxylase family protein [Dehalococcoidia bacterium]